MRLEAVQAAEKLNIKEERIIKELLRLIQYDHSWKVKAHAIKGQKIAGSMPVWFLCCFGFSKILHGDFPYLTAIEMHCDNDGGNSEADANTCCSMHDRKRFLRLKSKTTIEH